MKKQFNKSNTKQYHSQQINQLSYQLNLTQIDFDITTKKYREALIIATDYFCDEMLPDWKDLDNTSAWDLQTNFENAEQHIINFRPLTKVVHDLHQIILKLEKQIKKLKEEIRDAEEQES